MKLCEKCLVSYNQEYDYHLRDHMSEDYKSEGDCCDVCGNSLVEIDDIIAPIITTLWRKGYMTLMSCGGHNALNRPDMWHKLYIVFDLRHITFIPILIDALIGFCSNHDEAYLRWDPFGGLGLYFPSKTYYEHLNNLSALLEFCDTLPNASVCKAHPIPNCVYCHAEAWLIKLFKYEKFFYDIVVNDNNELTLLSFNFNGLYWSSIGVTPAFVRFNHHDFIMDLSLQSNAIAKIMEEYPIEEVIKNPNSHPQHNAEATIEHLKELVGHEVPNLWEK